MSNTLVSYFSKLNKNELVHALMGKLPSEFRHCISGMPNEAIQIKTTGKSGFNNMLEALDFCQAVMSQYNKSSEALDLAYDAEDLSLQGYSYYLGEISGR